MVILIIIIIIIITQLNDSIKFFTIYAPTHHLQVPIQTQNSVDTGNYIKNKHSIKTLATYQ
jgi:hypothetical protein